MLSSPLALIFTHIFGWTTGVELEAQLCAAVSKRVDTGRVSGHGFKPCRSRDP